MYRESGRRTQSAYMLSGARRAPCRAKHHSGRVLVDEMRSKHALFRIFQSSRFNGMQDSPFVFVCFVFSGEVCFPSDLYFECRPLCDVRRGSNAQVGHCTSSLVLVSPQWSRRFTRPSSHFQQELGRGFFFSAGGYKQGAKCGFSAGPPVTPLDQNRP